MKNCLVLDDEQHAIDILSEYISKVASLRLISALKNPIDAIGLIQRETIDVAFIDVQMPNLTGLQFLKLLNAQTRVVLCTAYTEYAVDGFDLNVVDYLLKPISLERFLQCVRKLDGRTAPTTTRSRTDDLENNFIFVKTESKGNYVKIDLNEILFVEGLGNYLKIQLPDKQIVCQLTMKSLEDQLEEYGFMRVHKSYLVAKNKITQVQGNSIHIHKSQIPVGENYRDLVSSFLKERTIIS